MSDAFIGEIQFVGFNFAPRGWAQCDGRLLPISQNQALFSLLGTTFGGDGRTTFGLPDLRGRVPLHVGSGPGLSPRAWGAKGGQQTAPLSPTTIPVHGHGLQPVTSADATTPDPSAGVPADSGSADAYATSGLTTLHAQTVTSTGGSQPHPNQQPSLGLLPVIATTGVFPSRN